MGQAFDDFYNMMERADTYCKKHHIWYEEQGFGCPECEYEAEEAALKGVDESDIIERTHRVNLGDSDV